MLVGPQGNRWLEAKCASFLEQAASRQLAATVKVTAPCRPCSLVGHQIEGNLPPLKRQLIFQEVI